MSLHYIAPPLSILEAKDRLLESLEDVHADVFDDSGGFHLSASLSESSDGMIVITDDNVILNASVQVNDARAMANFDHMIAEFKKFVLKETSLHEQ